MKTAKSPRSLERETVTARADAAQQMTILRAEALNARYAVVDHAVIPDHGAAFREDDGVSCAAHAGT